MLGRATTDDLEALLVALPPQIGERVRSFGSRSDLLELVLDLGRKPQARFIHGEELLLDREIEETDLAYVTGRIGVFGDDNRAGIERTLHRISALRNRAGKVVGLTCRIGRAVFGTIDIIRDIAESGQSILIMGRPGVGKTTMLREVARVVADDLGKRVIVVDTSNEIAGDGDIPHPGIGDARRMQVRTPTEQHAVMIEAVENHMPEVIVIDEIGTELEALAARTIAERGVQLVGTAHGNTLDNLMLNPTLSDLIGGIQTVTLGDEEARRRGTQKSVLERKAPPTFDVVVEILERDRVIVHRNVAETVDAILRGQMIPPEIRWRDESGEVRVGTKYDYQISETTAGNPAFAPLEPTGGYGSFSARPRGGAGGGGSGGFGGANLSGGPRSRARGRGVRAIAGEVRAEDPGPQFRVPTQLAGETLAAARPATGGSAGGATRGNAGGTTLPALPDADLYDAPGGGGVDARALGAAAGRTGGSGATGGGTAGRQGGQGQRAVSVFPFGVSRKRFEQAVRELGVPVHVAREVEEADAVLTLRNYYRQKPSVLREAESGGVPIYVLKNNTMLQMQSMLTSFFDIEVDPRESALRETEEAIGIAHTSGRPVELAPQNAYIRRLQHQMAERSNLMSRSRGNEPHRRVELIPEDPRAPSWR